VKENHSLASVLSIANEHSEKQIPGGTSCLGKRYSIGSGFTWKIRPGDTGANRQAVMESIERTLREHNGSFPEEGDMFIEPEKRKPGSIECNTS
jgi:hypothetical protein